jgi:hypothetical protein
MGLPTRKRLSENAEPSAIRALCEHSMQGVLP